MDTFEKLVDEGPVDSSKLLQDDEILTAEDKKKPDTSCNPESGSSGAEKPKKPCANCTCGLADQLESEARNKTTSDGAAPKSSCGSCGLGDAFRCASCPYRGMPAFKPGEKVKIDL